MRSFKWILINLVLIYISVVYAIPNIITDKAELTQENGTLSNVFVETYKYKPRKSFAYQDRKRLVLITSDRIERAYKLTDHYQIHWKKLLDKNAIGKELRVYLKTDNARTDPLIVELDKKRIYGKWTSLPLSILIVVMTVGITTYFIYRLIEKEN